MSISGYARVGVHSRKKETKHRVEKRSLVDEADYRFFPSFGGGRDPWRRGSEIERSYSFFSPFPRRISSTERERCRCRIICSYTAGNGVVIE